MENREIFALLNSKNESQILSGIAELERFRYSDYKMPPNISRRLIELLRYKSKSIDPEEAEVLEESVTHAVAALLAFTFGESWMLDELKNLLIENASPELTLETAVLGLTSLSNSPTNKNIETIKLLAQTALRSDIALSVRNTAYRSVLFLTGKMNIKEFAKQPATDEQYEFDLDWLNTLASS